jgi:hypothetical protein
MKMRIGVALVTTLALAFPALAADQGAPETPPLPSHPGDASCFAIAPPGSYPNNYVGELVIFMNEKCKGGIWNWSNGRWQWTPLQFFNNNGIVQ